MGPTLVKQCDEYSCVGYMCSFRGQLIISHQQQLPFQHPTNTEEKTEPELKNQQFAYATPKAQISCAVTAQLISTFVFATQIVLYLFFPHSKLQASSFFQWPVQPSLCWMWSETSFPRRLKVN